jgi:hypothetical protein
MHAFVSSDAKTDAKASADDAAEMKGRKRTVTITPTVREMKLSFSK